MNDAPPSQTMCAQVLLRNMIISGDLLPGARLRAESFGEEQGLCSEAVRFALRGLSEEGLLEPGDGGNVYLVRAFSLPDALDAIEIRGILEGTAARFAAERTVPLGRLARLDQLVDMMQGALDGPPGYGDLEAYAGFNSEFHQALRQLPGSALIERELERLSGLPFAAPSSFIQRDLSEPSFRLSMVTAQAQHRSLVDAIVQREGARAEAIAREHARLARQNFEAAAANRRASSGRIVGLSFAKG